MTKYIEEHHFNFDAAFDESINNETVRNYIFIYSLTFYLVVLTNCETFSGCGFQLCQSNLFCLWTDRYESLNEYSYETLFWIGSGKTYTMMGDSAVSETREIVGQVPGLYLLASQDLFYMLQTVKIGITAC